MVAGQGENRLIRNRTAFRNKALPGFPPAVQPYLIPGDADGPADERLSRLVAVEGL